MRETDLRRLERELHGMQLARARRSYGSMMLIDFGSLHEDGRDRRGRMRWVGDIMLMAEFADWQLRHADGSSINQSTNPRAIDIGLQRWRRSYVQRTDLDAQYSELRFRDGSCLQLWPTPPSYGPDRYVSPWTLFRRGKALCSVEHTPAGWRMVRCDGEGALP